MVRELEVAAGGLIVQPILRDPGAYEWSPNPTDNFEVHIVGHEYFKKETGVELKIPKLESPQDDDPEETMKHGGLIISPRTAKMAQYKKRLPAKMGQYKKGLPAKMGQYKKNLPAKREESCATRGACHHNAVLCPHDFNLQNISRSTSIF
ncbi:hypothetical protein PSPO01_16445 [Paraphaeosphaeria sporulosa]